MRCTGMRSRDIPAAAVARVRGSIPGRAAHKSIGYKAEAPGVQGCSGMETKPGTREMRSRRKWKQKKWTTGKTG